MLHAARRKENVRLSLVGNQPHAMKPALARAPTDRRAFCPCLKAVAMVSASQRAFRLHQLVQHGWCLGDFIGRKARLGARAIGSGAEIGLQLLGLFLPEPKRGIW